MNSIAWYLWHTSRWHDYANTLINSDRSQIRDSGWLQKMNVPRRGSGRGAYWSVVGDPVREMTKSVPAIELSDPVDKARLYRMLEDGSIGNERAKWLPGFLEGKTKSWFLSMAVWHTAEHLLGGVVCVRRVSGIPVGL